MKRYTAYIDGVVPVTVRSKFFYISSPISMAIQYDTMTVAVTAGVQTQIQAIIGTKVYSTTSTNVEITESTISI